MNEINKLRWRCRRGTLELETLLIRYLETRYPDADQPEREAFQRMLVLEDSELIHYLLCEQPAVNPGLQHVIAKVRTRPQ